MSDTIPFKVAGADGKEIEVAIPAAAVLEAVKDTHVPKERVEADFTRRVAGIIRNQGYRKPEELLDDTEFAAKVAEKHGFKKGGSTDDSAAAQQMREAISRALADQDAKVVKPLNEKLSAKDKRIDELLVRDLERQIVQAAAAAGVKKELLKSPGRGRAAPIVSILEDNFALDDESGEFFVSDGKEGFALSASRDADQTYMTVDEFINGWASSPDNATFVDRTGQAGPGVGGAPRGKAGDGNVWLTPEEASDGETYAQALKKVDGDYSRIRVKSPSHQTV